MKTSHALLEQGAQANTIVGGTSTSQSVYNVLSSAQKRNDNSAQDSNSLRPPVARASLTEEENVTVNSSGRAVSIGGSELAALKKVRRHQRQGQAINLMASGGSQL